MISKRISNDIPPQMKMFNMVIPILQSCLKLERCKPHKDVRHPMKCDVINDVKLFPIVYCGIYFAIFLRYPITCRVTKASALEYVLETGS